MTGIISIGVHIVCCCRRSAARRRKTQSADRNSRWATAAGHFSSLRIAATDRHRNSEPPRVCDSTSTSRACEHSMDAILSLIIVSDLISSYTTTVPHSLYVALDSGHIQLDCAYADRGHRLLAWSSQRHRQAPLSGSIGALPLLTVIDGTTRHFWSLVMM